MRLGGEGEDGCLVDIGRPIAKLHAGSEGRRGLVGRRRGQVQTQRQAGVVAGR